MGTIFYIMGKSSSGKDTIYQRLKKLCPLEPIVMYTTRPARSWEKDGVEYHFVTQEVMRELEQENKIIELRSYDTVAGIWYYFTAADICLEKENHNYLALGTLESYQKMRSYYGKERVVPLYIEVEDGIRLERAVRREQKQETPNYEEVCRRFLADQKDFALERREEAGITHIFYNNGKVEECVLKILDTYGEKMRQ